MNNDNRAADPPRSGRKTSAVRLARRGFLFAGLAAATTWALWPTPDPAAALSAPDAQLQAASGQILLIDIRRPDEWQRTGIGQGAHPLDMRRADFDMALSALVGGDTTRPIALICARGVRSRRLAARLSRAGFTQVADVSEGMEGSAAGPGWVRRGLPVVRP